MAKKNQAASKKIESIIWHAANEAKINGYAKMAWHQPAALGEAARKYQRRSYAAAARYAALAAISRNTKAAGEGGWRQLLAL